MFGIIQAVLSFLSNLIGGIFNTKQAEVSAGAAVDTATIQATAEVEKTWWFVSLLIVLFALPFAVYDTKVVLIDNVIAPIMHWKGAWAVTNPLHGDLAWVHRIAITGIFLHALSRS